MFFFANQLKLLLRNYAFIPHTLGQVIDPIFRRYLATLNGELKRLGVAPVFKITTLKNIQDFQGARTGSTGIQERLMAR